MCFVSSNQGYCLGAGYLQCSYSVVPSTMCEALPGPALESVAQRAVMSPSLKAFKTQLSKVPHNLV